MFQQAFGFVPPVSLHGSLVPSPGGPSLNFVWLPLLHERPARLHTVSHTPPPALSTKNPSPCRSTESASRCAHPYNDAAPAAPQTGALHRCIPCICSRSLFRVQLQTARCGPQHHSL